VQNEVWGPTTHLDRHANYFLDLIKDHLLVDLAPDVLVPTWRNNRAGGAFIAKRLDHILVAESLLSAVGRYQSWVELPYISDHAPVIAQFDFSQTRVAYPFKLNPTWLVEQDFALIVKEVWGDSTFLEEVDIQLRFVWKLKTLKSRIKDWARHIRWENSTSWKLWRRKSVGDFPSCQRLVLTLLLNHI
jgi:hypothetical protein